MIFRDILQTAMEEYGVTTRKLEEILVSRGVTNINFRRISEYKNGKFTPTYEKAKQILDALDYPITEEELLESLERNREEIKIEEEYTSIKQKELIVSARIKYNRLLPDIEPEQAERFLLERVRQVQGSEEKNFSNYIQMLIAKDLKNYLIDKEDLENEEH